MSTPNKGENKSVLKTIRFSESLARSLDEEAADEGITVNADVNSIIKRHFEWEKKAKQFGFTSTPRSLFLAILDASDNRMLAQIGREIVPSLWKELAEFWAQDSSPDGILESLKTRSAYNDSTQTKITRQGSDYTVVLRHDFGRKWSIVLKNALQEFVRQHFRAEARMTLGESVVTARFNVSSRSSST